MGIGKILGKVYSAVKGKSALNKAVVNNGALGDAIGAQLTGKHKRIKISISSLKTESGGIIDPKLTEEFIQKQKQISGVTYGEPMLLSKYGKGIHKKKGIIAIAKSGVRRLLRPFQQKRGLLGFMEKQKASGQIADDVEPFDIMSFIDQAGHRDVNLPDLNKANNFKV